MKNKALLYIGLGIICIISSFILKGSIFEVMENIGNAVHRFILSIQNLIALITNGILININNAIGLLIIIVMIIILATFGKEK